ncbi:glycerol kinase GlpK [Pseudenhygromyxa sp. WMMC2535]|uniref:glycerol kinase GlpK n=1 Tax=Pseudenhygromyxa sp. WMMC2535 TaxID=2712867 RepID=UPI0015570D8A|nr:glycerol kinase GlpK [Pseudenhygromyxa sp. WMMC2535]NVB39051.1 glycerol kinase GlpK [Pseudenhygromyxa sp. WMMC2535]
MPDADLILAIDQGTTGTTALILDRQLAVLARANREFTQHFPHSGWVEHEPDQIWTSVGGAIVEALGRANVDAARIAAVGITNQRETSLLWRRSDGRPVHRALVWQDRRTADVCKQLREAGHEETIRSRTGLVLDPYFSATKLAWTLDHVEGARAAAERGELAAGTIDTYLVWRMTGGAVHVTEPTNASRTLLWPLAGRARTTGSGDSDWDHRLCEIFRVPPSVLPDVRPCTSRFGETKGVPGLPDGVPIHGIAGDQQAALFGQACFARGQAKCTYGTGAFVVLNTGDEIVRSEHGLLTTVGWQIGDQTTYSLEGSAFMAGAVVQWLRDGLGMIETAAEVEDLAYTVPDSDGVVLVPAHAGLGAPHWRPDARGLIRGISRGTTRAHIARAALEGIALEVTDLLEAMASDLGAPIEGLRVDGGAAANDLLMQIQCDLLGVTLARPTILESTALGATFLAGLGVGLWPDTQAVAASWKQDRRFIPAGDPVKLAALREAWTVAVGQA